MDAFTACIRALTAFLACISVHVAWTSPNKAAPDEEAHAKKLGERLLKFNRDIIKFAKGLYWAVTAAEVFTIVVSQMPSTHLRHRILQALIPSGRIGDLHLTPLSVFGLTLLVSGSWLRWKCYQTLDDLFTFELSIRKDHRLVTHGPYSIVRHPSYTGLVAVHAGMYCWYGSKGGWLRESGLLHTNGGLAIAVVLSTLIVGGTIGSLFRIPLEDSELRKLFSMEWEQWAERVPYALFPGVY